MRVFMFYMYELVCTCVQHKVFMQSYTSSERGGGGGESVVGSIWKLFKATELLPIR